MINAITPDERLLSAEIWHLDPWHTAVHFRALNRGAGWVRGRFGRVDGQISFFGDVERPLLDVTIDLTSVSTGVARRDQHLRSADYLDAEAFPRATFHADRLARTGDLSGVLYGELTLHGVTRPVELETEWRGTAPDPFSDGEHVAFSASTTIALGDFGIRPKILPGLSISSVGDRVRVDLDVVLLSYDPAPLLETIPVG